MFSSIVAFPSKSSVLRQLMVYIPVSVIFTLQNMIQFFCTLNLRTTSPLLSVMKCLVLAGKEGSEVTVKWRVGDSPALAST